MPAKRFRLLRLAYRCLRWPIVRIVRMPGRIKTAFVHSRVWRPVRRRIIAWRYSVQQTPGILDRLDTIEARYWDHVALVRRVAMLEEHVERLLLERDGLSARGGGRPVVNAEPIFHKAAG